VTRLARIDIVATVAVVLGLAATAACASEDGPEKASRSSDARKTERALLSDLSAHFHYSNPRCVEIDASLPWTFACTVQQIGLNGLPDEPLLAIGVDSVGDGRAGSTSGVVPLPAGCATDVRCWVEHLCHSYRGCAANPQFMRFPDLGPNVPPRRIDPEVCLDAWNVHGGFTPDQLAVRQPSRPDEEVERPVYAPHLAAATMGFIGLQADVRAGEGRCSVAFDLGGGLAYGIDASVRYAPRFWTWAGRNEMTTVADERPSWNACQRDDGTLMLGNGCRHDPQLVARDVADEIERRYLHRVSDLGGFPYWLGPRFLGARPEPRPPGQADATIRYAVESQDGLLSLLVLTYYGPPGQGRDVGGIEVVRAQPVSGTVLVVASRAPPPDVRRAVRKALRPFLGSNPLAEQVPGDLAEEPTRVDTSVRVRVYWVGATAAGREAAQVEDAPDGVGVVRYGPAGGPRTFHVVTYKPMKKTRCSSLGCVAPPPLPASLRRFGTRVHASILGGWIVDVLAPSKKHAPSPSLFLTLTRLR
jgi:hypothetical protein